MRKIRIGERLGREDHSDPNSRRCMAKRGREPRGGMEKRGISLTKVHIRIRIETEQEREERGCYCPRCYDVLVDKSKAKKRGEEYKQRCLLQTQITT